MAQKFITLKELESWINTEIQKTEGCEDIYVTSIHRLRELDPEGNNWSAHNFRITGVSEDIYTDAITEVIGKAKKLFNIIET